uniref:RHS repeat protein n=1 Tax=Syphacia muris TaxID=451379 RepID=A0A0N5ACH4_9BILA
MSTTIDRDFNLTGLTTVMGEYWDGDASSYRKLLTRNAYRYDKAGNCIEKETMEGKTGFVYDSLYQLTGVNYPNGSQEHYTYDKADNRLTMTTDTLLETYAYDGANRLTERSI